MAAQTYHGISYLDLSGNMVVWNAGDKNHSKILLFGWNFKHSLPLATLAISALCLLCFFGLLLALYIIYCGRRNTRQWLPWAYVWIPVLSLIG